MPFSLENIVYKKNRPKDLASVTNVNINGSYEITFIHNDSVTTASESELLLYVPNKTMWNKFIDGTYDDTRQFALNFTFSKLQNYTQNTLSTFRASKTIFFPFQYIPLVKMLHNPKRRLLLCDEVGLGKTIESGIILLELKARKELQSAIICCPKSLREKWRDEMYERFGLRFEIAGSKKDLKNTLVSNERLGVNQTRIITTFDTLRNTIADFKEEQESNNEVNLSQLFNLDVFICDEAHYLKNLEAKRTRMVSEVTNSFKTILFLTATPIMNDKADLFSLLRMLDPDEYSDKSYFDIQIENNRPFIRALTALSKGTELKEVANELEVDLVPKTRTFSSEKEAFVVAGYQSVLEKFGSNQAFQQLTTFLKLSVDSPKNRVKAQRLINDFNVLGNILTRNRRKEVLADTHYTKRTVIDRSFILSSEENVIWQQCDTKIRKKYDEMDRANFGYIGKSQLLASSLHAFNRTSTEFKSPDYDDSIPDSKFNELLTLVKERNEKMLIFSRYLNTISYLENRFEENGINSLTFTGKSTDRKAIIDNFKKSDIDLLILSEAGNEGIDLQFCSTLVNYDLPWNPMRIEQRIGRIDRLGQEAERIIIINFFQKNTIEERVYKLLKDKIKVFEESIGDLEAILSDNGIVGEAVERLIKDASLSSYYKDFSQSEQKEKLDSILRAKELNEQQLNDVEFGLSGALVNDAFFRDEVERIRTEKRYITSLEMYGFIQLYLQERANHCSLSKKHEGIYHIELPINDNETFLKTIREDIGQEVLNGDNELASLLKSFEFNYHQNKLNLVFDWDKSPQDEDVIHINAIHPLVIAALNYFGQKTRQLKNKSYKLDIKLSDIKKLSSKENTFLKKDGAVLLITFNINVTAEQPYSGENTHKRQHILALPFISEGQDPYHFLLNDDEFEFYEELGFKIYHGLVTKGEPYSYDDLDFSTDTLRPMIDSLNQVIVHNLSIKVRDEEKNQLIARYQTHLMNLEEVTKAKIERAFNTIDNAKREEASKAGLEGRIKQQENIINHLNIDLNDNKKRYKTAQDSLQITIDPLSLSLVAIS